MEEHQMENQDLENVKRVKREEIAKVIEKFHHESSIEDIRECNYKGISVLAICDPEFIDREPDLKKMVRSITEVNELLLEILLIMKA